MLYPRTTPIDNNLPSPCELPNGKENKSNLPAVSSRSNGDVNALLQQQHDVYKSYHDRMLADRTANELAPLSPQQTVRELNPIRKTWDLDKVTNKSTTPRLFDILTAHGTAYRRNRRHLRDTQEGWKEQSRMMVSMTTSKKIERLHIPEQSHNPNRQWQSATHNALKHGSDQVRRVSKPPNRLDL